MNNRFLGFGKKRIPLIRMKNTITLWVSFKDSLTTTIRKVHSEIAMPQAEIANLFALIESIILLRASPASFDQRYVFNSWHVIIQ